jgi:hypothetical protein
VRLSRTSNMLGIGALLVVLTSGPAMAIETGDGTATVTWPGYDTSFVAGSPRVPNTEPVVIDIVLTSELQLRDFYFEIPGLPNPSYFIKQEDVSLNADGQYFYPGSDQLVFTVETVPSPVSYADWTAYFFDASRNSETLVGGGIFGVDHKIQSLRLTLAPGAVVQVNSETNISVLQLTLHTNNPTEVVFENFPMLTPALAPETPPAPKSTPALKSTPPATDPGPGHTQGLAQTGTGTLWLTSTSAVAVAAMLTGSALALAGRRRPTSDG